MIILAKEILLNSHYKVIVDDEDFEWLNMRKWQYDKGYARCIINNKNVRMHRLILNAPSGKDIDHINGNCLDNRKINLRFATKQQNNFNKKKQSDTSSKYKGVYWHKQTQKWSAYIRINKKFTYIGVYADEKDAAMAYNKLAIIYFGEFAKLNEII